MVIFMLIFMASKQCALNPDRSKGMSVCACMFHIGYVCCWIFIFTCQAKSKQITELSRCFINASVLGGCQCDIVQLLGCSG